MSISHLNIEKQSNIWSKIITDTKIFPEVFIEVYGGKFY